LGARGVSPSARVESDGRFVLGVTYHDTDASAITAVVGGRPGATAASAESANGADGQHQARQGGKLSGNGKRGR
jgi:hypothetical protein